jgi:putative transcriptional regulator
MNSNEIACTHEDRCRHRQPSWALLVTAFGGQSLEKGNAADSWDLLPRRCPGSDSDDSDLPKRNQRRFNAQREDGVAENQRGVVTLDKKLFKRLVESMGQMDEIVRGVRAPSREFYVDASKVKEIRAITGLSQPKFAKLLHVDVGTLRNWEQGRREPTGPAQALLRAIKNNPQAVLKALAA